MLGLRPECQLIKLGCFRRGLCSYCDNVHRENIDVRGHLNSKIRCVGKAWNRLRDFDGRDDVE